MVNKITSYEIISLFLNDYSKKYYLREIARFLEKPHQSVKPYVEGLIKKRILIKDQRKNIIDYGLNIRNKLTYDYIIISEKERLIKRLKDDSLMSVLYEKLSKYFNESTFVIFGSSSIESKKGSDIDLLIIGKKDIKKELSDFEEIYNKKIHMIQIDQISKANIGFVNELYKKHLILNNTESLINYFRNLYEKNQLV